MIGTRTSPEPKKSCFEITLAMYTNLPRELGVIEESIVDFESEGVGVKRQTTCLKGLAC
jgi:hypothetical protein